MLMQFDNESCYFAALGASNSLYKHASRQRWFLVSKICHRLPKLTLCVAVSTRMVDFNAPWVAKCRDDSLRRYATVLRITLYRLADQPFGVPKGHEIMPSYLDSELPAKASG